MRHCLLLERILQNATRNLKTQVQLFLLVSPKVTAESVVDTCRLPIRIYGDGVKAEKHLNRILLTTFMQEKPALIYTKKVTEQWLKSLGMNNDISQCTSPQIFLFSSHPTSFTC